MLCKLDHKSVTVGIAARRPLTNTWIEVPPWQIVSAQSRTVTRLRSGDSGAPRTITAGSDTETRSAGRSPSRARDDRALSKVATARSWPVVTASSITRRGENTATLWGNGSDLPHRVSRSRPTTPRIRGCSVTSGKPRSTPAANAEIQPRITHTCTAAQRNWSIGSSVRIASIPSITDRCANPAIGTSTGGTAWGDPDAL